MVHEIRYDTTTVALFLLLMAVGSRAAVIPATANAYDQNEDGLDDRFDRNRDGKPDFVYVLPPAAAAQWIAHHPAVFPIYHQPLQPMVNQLHAGSPVSTTKT
jgi:hypothetical protein